jgi:3-dehydroquinate synthase
LPDRELRAGLAEVVKYGFALDAPFAAWLEQNIEKLRARERVALQYAVRRCCEIKARVVAADERESGERALLNFGHTFGHAIEGGAGYGNWLHGEAVSAGMVMAGELSRRLGLISEADVARLRKLLERAGLPIAGPKLRPEGMIELMAVDKKAAHGKVRFIVLNSIGSASLRGNVDAALVREAIVSAMQ